MIEYLVLDVSDPFPNPAEFEEMLNDIGREGWKPGFSGPSRLTFWREVRESSDVIAAGEKKKKFTRIMQKRGK